MLRRNGITSFALKASLAALALAAAATSHAEPGINDKEIVWGNSSPLSGPNAGYGPIGRAQRAWLHGRSISGLYQQLGGAALQRHQPAVRQRNTRSR